MLKRFVFIFFLLQLYLSCVNIFTTNVHQYEKILAPEEVRVAALKYAHKYEELGAEYEWGAQDPLPQRLAVDCSGLVVRCYQYACRDYGYVLLFDDMTAAGMQNYSIKIDTPEPGDLIFMGEEGIVSHIALFERREGNIIYFIDATEIPEQNINGVTERSYESTNPKFISFGRLLIGKPIN